MLVDACPFALPTKPVRLYSEIRTVSGPVILLAVVLAAQLFDAFVLG